MTTGSVTRAHSSNTKGNIHSTHTNATPAETRNTIENKKEKCLPFETYILVQHTEKIYVSK